MAVDLIEDTGVSSVNNSAASSAVFSTGNGNALTTNGTNRYAVMTLIGSTYITGISGGGTWVKLFDDHTNNFSQWGCPLTAQQTNVTVTATFNSSAPYGCFLQTFKTSNGSIPVFDTAIGSTTSSATPTINITTGTNNCVILCWGKAAYIGAPTIVNGAGYNLMNSAINGGTSTSSFQGEIATADTPTSGTLVQPGMSVGSGSFSYIAALSLSYSAFVPTIEHCQFYGDNGTTINNASALAGTTLTAASDGNFYDIEVGVPFRVRFEVANTGGQSGSIARRLEFSEDGGAWTQITTGTNNIRLQSSTHFSDGDATTQRLAAVGSFQAGQGKQSASDTSSITLATSSNVEDEWCVQFQATAAGHSYQLRPTNAGTPLTGTLNPTIAPINWSSQGALQTATYAWQNRKMHANLKTNNANFPAYVKLVDITSSADVANSKVGTTNTSFTEITGSAFNMTSGHQYQAKIGVAHNATVSLLRTTFTG